MPLLHIRKLITLITKMPYLLVEATVGYPHTLISSSTALPPAEVGPMMTSIGATMVPTNVGTMPGTRNYAVHGRDVIFVLDSLDRFGFKVVSQSLTGSGKTHVWTVYKSNVVECCDTMQ